MRTLHTLLLLALLLRAAKAVPPGPGPHGGAKAQSSRYAADLCMRLARAQGTPPDQLVGASRQLFEAATGGPAPSRWKDYVERWHRRSLDGEGMAGHRPGPRPRISATTAQRIAEDWSQQGVGRGAQWRPYRSMEEVSVHSRCRHVGAAAAARCTLLQRADRQAQRHCFLQAIEKHPQLSELARRLHLDPAYLAKKCKAVSKDWRFGPITEKRAFDRNEKWARRRYASEALQRPMDYWKSTVFVDEHTCYRRPIPLPAIWLAGRRRARRVTTKDKRHERQRWRYPKLHFMYGVHWALGVLGPYWVSDCTGWRKAKRFTTKASAPPAATPARAHLPPVDVTRPAGGGLQPGGLGILCCVQQQAAAACRHVAARRRQRPRPRSFVLVVEAHERQPRRPRRIILLLILPLPLRLGAAAVWLPKWLFSPS